MTARLRRMLPIALVALAMVACGENGEGDDEEQPAAVSEREDGEGVVSPDTSDAQDAEEEDEER
jgi:hypothetical protein